MSFLTGIIAALAGPLVMTIGFIIWDNDWSGSPFSLNLFKCNLASIGFIILSIATRPDDPFSPAIFEWQNVGFLMLSSVIGIIVGDLTWLESLRLLGARRVIVMDSLKPFLAAVFGWAFLGEQLQLGALGGIFLTVVGILLVSLDSEKEENAQVEKEIMEEAANDALAPRIIPPGSAENATTEPPSLSIATGSFPGPADTSGSVTVDEGIEIGLESAQNEEQHTAQYAQDLPSTQQLANLEAKPARSQSINNSSKRAQNRQQLYMGYALSVINVGLDTYGSVLTKDYGTEFSTWEINLIRFGFAGLVMAISSLVLVTRDRLLLHKNKKKQDLLQSERENETSSPPDKNNDNATQPLWYCLPTSTMTKSAWLHVSLGVLFVTFFTPALSNYALFQIALALALTLGSVGPLYALPLTYFMQRHEHSKMPSLRACLGALLAIAGIVVLAFWGTLD